MEKEKPEETWALCALVCMNACKTTKVAVTVASMCLSGFNVLVKHTRFPLVHGRFAESLTVLMSALNHVHLTHRMKLMECERLEPD